mmetsp:Transcript_16839/g.39097  ORF Transcript_16839/g.39097 Transcript_16839/m.39097 type:complete len:283 (-) Transcript_16839:103-951(-)
MSLIFAGWRHARRGFIAARLWHALLLALVGAHVFPACAAAPPNGMGLLRAEGSVALVGADGSVQQAQAGARDAAQDVLLSRAMPRKRTVSSHSLEGTNAPFGPCMRSAASFVDETTGSLDSTLQHKVVPPEGGAKHAKVKIAAADICLGLLIEWANISFTLEPCKREFGDKVWSYNAWQQIGVAKDVVCLEGDPYRMEVLVQACAEQKTAKRFKHQQWTVDLEKKSLYMTNSPKHCISIETQPQKSNIGLADCNPDDVAQQWVMLPQKYAAGHEPFQDLDNC